MGIETLKAARVCKASALLLSLLLVAGAAGARERKVLQKVSTAPADPQARAADAWIDQTPGSTTTNHGSDTTLKVTSFQNGATPQNQRALVGFDLSSIPSSGIKQASLTLFLSTAPSTSRTYQTRRVTSLWTESAVTWADRLPNTAWGAAGGDLNGAATSTQPTGTTSGVFLTWDLTADVQQYFGSTTPSGNYGTAIRDATESNTTGFTSIFSSKEDTTEAHRPALTVDFIQDVQGLTATEGNAQVTLNWEFPPTIGAVISPTVGVLIIRAAGAIPSTVVPTDGTAYTTCSNAIAGVTVVFSSSSTATTSFVDGVSNPACAPVNDTQYSYKVFAKDAANAYSFNGTGGSATSILTPFASATPSATAANRQGDTWVSPTGAASVGAPGLIPSTVVTLGTGSSLLFGIKPADGTPVFGPVTAGGTIQDQPPVIAIGDSSSGHNVSYFAASDGFVYAVDASTGALLWLTNPSGATPATGNGFTNASPSVFVKSFSTAAYTRTSDLVVIGTRNGGSTTANQIDGLDGNTGAIVWQLIGASGGNPNMDIVASTPVIDYKNNAIWVTSHANGGTTQPSIWKINPNTGARIAAANLGNMSTWPVVPVGADVVFAGTDAGTLFALSPTSSPTITTLASASDGDTTIVGAPLVLTFSSPYTIIFAGATTIQEWIFNKSTNTFTTTGAGTFKINTPGGCTPTAPLGFPSFPKVYFGCSDGHIYQVDIGSGTIDGNRLLRSATTIGDLAMDVTLNVIMAGSTNSRVYAYTFPF